MESIRKAAPIRLHYFFRNPASGGAYSIERVFNALIAEIPSDQFIVKRLVCPFRSKGLIRRVLLMIWAAFRQGDINHITGDINFIGIFMRRDKTVQTVHDVRSLQRLEGLRRTIYKMFWLTLPLYRAGWVTVISDATCREVAYYGTKHGDRIRTIPNCLTVKFEELGPPPNNQTPRILQVGTMPNKNLEGAVAALKGFPCVLVVVGELTSMQLDAIREAGLTFENYVALDDAALLDQYRRANLVLFVSTYEGFGLPILEAQALGRPVITSDREPMRSVAGGGAILVNPDSPTDIRRAVERFFGNPDIEARLREEGKKNASNYLPENIAPQYCALYTEMVRRGRET